MHGGNILGIVLRIHECACGEVIEGEVGKDERARMVFWESIPFALIACVALAAAARWFEALKERMQSRS